jgi:hypothetical protein
MLTFMALRLYTKGKQTYAKETKLLQAAKAEAKERRAERNSSVPPTPRLRSSSQQAFSQAGASQYADDSAAVAVPERRQLQRGGGYKDTLTRSFSRSVSRLRGNLIVGGLEPGSLTSPRPGAMDDIAAAADVGHRTGSTSDQTAHKVSQQAIEGYLGSTLFQVKMDRIHCTTRMAELHVSA